MTRIAKRNRLGEEKITQDYLEKLAQHHECLEKMLIERGQSVV